MLAIPAVQRGQEAAEGEGLPAQVRRGQRLRGMPGAMATITVAAVAAVQALSAEPIPRHLERQQATAGMVLPLQSPARLLQEPVAVAVAVAMVEQAAGMVAVAAADTAAALFRQG